MTYNALNQYKQNTVLTATPEELTLMLYDGGIKFMNIGKYAIEKKEIEKAGNALTRAQNIVSELDASLDMDYEVADNLRNLYGFVMDKLVDANINKEIEPINEALEIFVEMRDTWKVAMKDVKQKVYQNR